MNRHALAAGHVTDDGFTALCRLTGLTNQVTTSGTAYNALPYWGPDGATLLYQSNVNPADTTSTTTYSIWSVKLDGAAPKVAVPPAGGIYDYSPLQSGD